MADHQTRDSKDAPWNAEDDNGLRYCNDCCMTVKGNKDGEYQHCYEHETDVSTLREEIALCNDRIESLEKRICALVEYKAKMEVLNAEWQRAAQEQAETIKVLESRCRYKQAHIEELQNGKEVH